MKTRQFLKKLALAAMLWLPMWVLAQAPPPNDACTGATLVFSGSTITGTTLASTPDFGLPLPCAGTPYDPSSGGVWFIYRGEGTPVTASTCAPGGFNTRLHVFEGGCSSLSCVAANDDDGTCSFSTFKSKVTWTAISGRTYYIFLSGREKDQGEYSLTITKEAPTVTITASAPCVDSCITLTASFSGAGTELGYTWTPCTSSAGTPCTGPSIKVCEPGTYIVMGEEKKTGTRYYDTLTVAPCVPCPPLFAPTYLTLPGAVSGTISICQGSSVYFDGNASVGTTEWLWLFGDGGFSTDVNPTHTYYSPGTYTVTVHASNDCADTTFTVDVQVESLPGPDIYCPSTVCEGDTAVYSTSAVCANYVWGVSGGTIISSPTNTNSIMVVWGAGPLGSVSLATPGCGAFCSNPTVAAVPIVPNALAINGPTVRCPGDAAVYTVPCIPGTAYNWIVDAPAVIISGQGTHEVLVDWPSTFTGTTYLTVEYVNELAGCEGKGTLAIQVLPEWRIGGPQALCPGVVNTAFPLVSIDNSTLAPVNANWTVTTPGGGTVTGPSGVSTFDTYDWSAGPGTYTVTATYTGTAYCNSVATFQVTVLSPLAAPGISGPAMVCPGGSATYSVLPNASGTSYTWTISGGTPATATGPSVVVNWGPGGGALTVSQVMDNAPFCASPASAPYVVATFAPVALPAITGPLSACKGTTSSYGITGSPDPSATYVWSVSPSGIATVSSGSPGAATVAWQAAGVATLTLSVVTPCDTQATSVSVTVNPLPNATTGIDQTICVGASANLGGATVSGSTYSWTPAAGLSCTTCSNPVASPGTTTTYTLTETNAVTGCSFSRNVTVTVNPAPVADAGADASMCPDGSVAIGAAPVAGLLYQWTPSFSLSSNIVSNPTASPVVTTTYTLVVTDGVTGCHSTDAVTVTVNPSPVPVIGSTAPACAGQAVSFTGSAGTTWAWDFGDGNTSTLQNPSNTYSAPGTYVVELTLTDANGCTGSTSVLVDVKPVPNAILSSPDPLSTCGPHPVTLYTQNGTGYTYSWTPTLPATSSNTVTPLVPTSYQVVITNAYGCSDSSNVVTIFPDACDSTCACVPGFTPTLDFTYLTTSCTDASFTITTNISGLVNPVWWFGDGNTAPVTGTSTTHTYTTPGLYEVYFSGLVPGVDCHGDSSLCYYESPRYVVSIPLIADFYTEFDCNAGVIETDFFDLSQYFDTHVINDWKWYLDGSGTPFSTVQDPANVVIAPGAHTVTLVIASTTTLATCTITLPVNVPTPGTASFTAPSPVCANTPVTFTNTSTGTLTGYLWNFGGPVSTAVSPTFTFTSAGTFTVTLTAYDVNGCTFTTSQTVTVNAAPTPDAGSDAAICPGGSVTLGTASIPGSSYLWSPAAGLSSATVANPVASPATSTLYSLTETSSNGCSASDLVLVSVRPTPLAYTGPDVSVCESDGVVIGGTAVGGNTYFWTPSLGLSNPADSDPIASPAVTTTYTLVETDILTGCSATQSVTVTVNPNPVSDAGADVSFCPGVGAVIGSGSLPGLSYTWYPAAGLSSTTSNPTVANPASTTTYTLITRDDATGCAMSDNVTVTVHPTPPALITGDDKYCVGDPFLLTSVSGSYLVEWHFDNEPVGDGDVVINYGPTLSGASVPLGANGDFWVVVTDFATGCTASSDKFHVTVYPKPAAPIITAVTGSAPLCEDLHKLEVTNPQPGVTYEWSNGAVGTSNAVSNAGDYTVTATSPEGCTSVSNVITIHPNPDLSCVPSGCYEVCDTTTSLTIPGPAGYASYEWYESGVGIASTAQDLIVTHSGTYTLVVISDAGCKAQSESITVTFVKCDCSEFTVAVSGTGVSCPTSFDGTATATPSGGSAPYAYLWSNGQTTATATGLGVGTYAVTVVDSRLCDATGSVTLSVACGGTTFTQGGWGANPSGANPGSYLHANFAGAFPGGLVVGCTRTLTFTSAAAITTFLPSGSSPSVLPSSMVNPPGSYNNVLAGQVVALKLSVTFDAYDPAFSSSPTLLGDQIITSGTFAGWTVSALLAEAEKKLGNCPSPYSFSQLNNAVSSINENYIGGSMDGGFLSCPCTSAKSGEGADGGGMDVLNGTSAFTAWPNPFHGTVNIAFSAAQSADATLEVFDLTGVRVATLFRAPVQSGALQTMQFDGSHLPQGVYHLRLSVGSEVKTTKLVVLPE